MDDDKRNTYSDRLKEITDKMTEGVRAFKDSDEFKKYLSFMGKFHRYSFRNSLLIFLQNPKSELCASFSTWKQMGRYVRSGEKGMVILCPAFEKMEVDLIDKASGKPVLDADGKPKKEEVTIQKYTLGYTFDVSQTEGKEIPRICNELDGVVEDYPGFFGAIRQTADCPIAFENIEGGAKGYYSPKDHRIAIKGGMSELQTIKTALHELCHSRCECLSNKDNEDFMGDRAERETRAEATAYVVCSYFGMDCSDYSFPYLATWASKDFKELSVQLSMIQKVSSEIISEMEKHLGIEPMKFMEEAKEASRGRADNKKQNRWKQKSMAMSH